jgi:predicted acetyltransferase
MNVELRAISADEVDAFQQALGVTFGFDTSPEWRASFRQLFDVSRLTAAFDAGQIVATFGALNLQLTVPGGSLPTAGTTVVTVMPTHRRQGLLRAWMRQHLADVHDRQEPLAALWASESSIYGRFGYGPASERVVMSLDKSFAHLRQPVEIAGVMRLVDRQQAMELFPGVYQQAIRTRPGTFARSQSWWEHRVLCDPEEMRHGATSHRRAVQTRGGEPCGYVIYRTVGQFHQGPSRVQVLELTGIDPEAEKALWQYVFGIDLISSIEYGNQPVDDSLRWWLEQPRRMQRRTEDALWVRVIDVVSALEGRRYDRGGQLTFRMRDDLCPWNQGVYCLEVGQEGTASCRKTTSDPEIDLTPSALGSVYLGGNQLRDLARAGVVTGSRDALDRADGMFAWHPQPWCQELF